MSRPILISAAVALAVAAALAGAWLARLATSPAPMQAQVLETPRQIPDLPMTDHEGQPFGIAEFEGRWTLAFFGFTHCPDVCPATLQLLAGARRRLDDLPAAEQPGVLMISLDPDRDSPQRLADYVPYFHPEFRGLNVAAQHLPELTRSFGAAYAYAPLGEDDYTVDHSTALYLVDKSARVAAVFPAPHTAEGIAEDLRRIIALEEIR
jgi:protein SCO1/2